MGPNRSKTWDRLEYDVIAPAQQHQDARSIILAAANNSASNIRAWDMNEVTGSQPGQTTVDGMTPANASAASSQFNAYGVPQQLMAQNVKEPQQISGLCSYEDIASVQCPTQPLHTSASSPQYHVAASDVILQQHNNTVDESKHDDDDLQTLKD